MSKEIIKPFFQIKAEDVQRASQGTGGTSTALAQKVKDAPALITLRKMRVTSDTDDAGYFSKKTLDSCI